MGSARTPLRAAVDNSMYPKKGTGTAVEAINLPANLERQSR